jgi:hypothetical protein
LQKSQNFPDIYRSSKKWLVPFLSQSNEQMDNR